MEDKKEIKNILDSIDTQSENTPDTTQSTLASQSELSNSEVQELVEDAKLEEKYGSSPIKAAAASAASAASFGLSDQALVKSGIMSDEALREYRQRNEAASLAGEAAGIIGPAMLSGGSSLAAKGVSAGVSGAAKAGLMTEKATAAALKKAIKETGKEKIARRIIEKSAVKGAGSAVEGAFYGAGQLISEDALGTADFNAENLAAHVGTGAILGGVAGGVLGGVNATIPKLSKEGKVTGWVNKKIKGTLNPQINVQKAIGASENDIRLLKKNNMAAFEHAPVALKKILQKSPKSIISDEHLLNSVKKEMDEVTGPAIDSVLKKLDKAAVSLPKRSKVGESVLKELDELQSRLKLVDAKGRVLPGSEQALNKINKQRKVFTNFLKDNETITASELQSLKTDFYDKSGFGIKAVELPIEKEIFRSAGRALRKEITEIAEKTGGPLGEELKETMLDWGTYRHIARSLGKNISSNKTNQFDKFKDSLLAGAAFGGVFIDPAIVAGAVATRYLNANTARKLSTLVDIERANQAIEKSINKTIKNFQAGTTDPKIALATKALLNSGLTRTETGRKPKSKKEALKTLQKNIEKYKNPQTQLEALEKFNIQDEAPATDATLKGTMISAINFLDSKVPRNESVSPFSHLFNTEWQPSTQEMAKFERYLHAIENPLQAFKELQNGTLTRETVEVLQNVYPNIYERIQSATMTAIAENPEQFDYNKRLSLGILLNIPTDASLVNENIAALQQHFSETKESQTGGATQFSASKAENLDMAESEATPVQKTEKA